MEPWIGSYSERPRTIQKVIIIISLVALCGLSGMMITIKWFGRVTDQILSRPFNLLLIGVDQKDRINEEEKQRTDTILFATFNSQIQKIGLFSIPRDSLVEIPGHGTDRINMAYFFGGYPLTKTLVEEVMGMTVHGYVLIDYDGFRELVDTIDGVEVTVDKRMYYIDQSAGLEINLQEGRQVLNGEDALGFVRYRQDKLGDITRIRRQQEFIKAVIKRLTDREMLGKSLSLLRIARKYLKTDLRLSELVALYRFYGKVDLKEDLFIRTLPGEFSGPYWKLKPKEIDKLLEIFRLKE